jgi:hypothetical protein
MDNLQAAPLTFALGKVALAAGTTTTISNTGTTVFAIRGKAYSKAAMTNAATPTLDWSTGKAFVPLLVNQGCAFMVGFDHSGNVQVIQGAVVGMDGSAVASASFANAPAFSGWTAPMGSVASTSNDFCPIGYILIKCGSDFVAGSWTFGSSNLSSVTGVGYTFTDVIGWPDRPQVA